MSCASPEEANAASLKVVLSGGNSTETPERTTARELLADLLSEVDHGSMDQPGDSGLRI